MIRTSVPCFVLAIMAALNIPASPIAAQESDEVKAAEREQRMAIMSTLTGEVRIFETIGDEEVEVDRGENPVTRFDDNA